MLRRNLLRMRRYPSMTVMLIGHAGAVPAAVRLRVRRDARRRPRPAGAGGRAEYLAYVTPAIMLMAVAAAAQGTAISVAMDMTEGIVARFRTMAISPGRVLTGHVLGSLDPDPARHGVVLVVAVLLGFRPDGRPRSSGSPRSASLTLVAFALTWLTVALGWRPKRRDGQQHADVPDLPAVPQQRLRPDRSMPAGSRWFAEHQPFTPMIETLRGLLAGTPDRHDGARWPSAGAWLIAVVGYLWARALYRREPSR